MTHQFDTKIAEMVGVNAAVIYANIEFWCLKNKANATNFHDGRYWTYNSLKAWGELFSYLSVDQIRGALKKLEDSGLIVTGYYNEAGYDRTKWYAVKSQNHMGKTPDGFGENVKPIPDNKPDNKPDKGGGKEKFHIGVFSPSEFQRVKKYRSIIGKPFKTQAAVTGLSNSFGQCYKKGYTFEQLFSIMEEKQWTTIKLEWVEKEIKISPPRKQEVCL